MNEDEIKLKVLDCESSHADEDKDALLNLMKALGVGLACSFLWQWLLS